MTRILPPWSVPLALGTLLLGALAGIYRAEEVSAGSAALVVASAIGLVATWPVMRRPVPAGALLLNLCLVLLYFWSLGETHHIAVRVTASGFVATVDGDTATLRVHPAGHDYGLEAGSYDSYRIQATGEALQADTRSLLGRIAETFRLAQPGSAWANLEVHDARGRTLVPHRVDVEEPAASWSATARGELEGSPGSFLLIPPPAGRAYTISADLVRPDGIQSLLLGVDRRERGYALQLRFDQPDALWVTWNRGDFVKGVGGVGLHHVALVPEVQRVLRVVLTGYLFALLFLGLTIGLYPVLVAPRPRLVKYPGFGRRGLNWAIPRAIRVLPPAGLFWPRGVTDRWRDGELRGGRLARRPYRHPPETRMSAHVNREREGVLNKVGEPSAGRTPRWYRSFSNRVGRRTVAEPQANGALPLGTGGHPQGDAPTPHGCTGAHASQSRGDDAARQPDALPSGYGHVGGEVAVRAASHIAAVVPGDHAAGVLHEQGQRGRPDLTVWSFFVAVTGAALLATGLVSTYLLERIPHVQDSVAYLFQAKIFATGAFHVPAPPQAVQSFFMEQFLPFYNGTWFSQYPPGHPLMLMLGVLAGAPWLVEPVLSSLALGCIFFLGRRLYGAGVGALAALLGLSSPFWLFLGSSFMSHGTGLFFAATFLLCFARVEDERRAAWPFLAGFLAAMAFITRELTAVGVIGPFVLYVLIFRYRRWRAYLPALAGACLPLAFFLVYNWAQVGSPLSSTYTAWDQNFALGFGDHVSPLGAFTPADGIWNIYQNQSMLAAQLFGWPYGVALAFAFVPFAVCAARRWDYLLLASFAGVVVVHALYWAPGLMYGPRYYYEALPALLLLTARGVVELGRLPLRVWPAFRPGRHPGAGAVLPAVLILGLVSFNLWFYLPAQLPLYRHYNYSSAAELRAVARARVHHALVFVVSHPPGFWASYGNVFFANDPHLRGDIVYARDEGDLNSLLYPYFPGRAHYRLSGTRLRRLP